LILVSSLNRVESVGVSPLNLGGVVGFEVQGNLMNQLAQSLKRMMDIGVVLIGSVFALPLLVVLSVMVKLDSKGPIFYGHTRVGKNGKEFTMWKFRSMASNADQVLEQYLRDNPSLREEWESDQKLKNDPRITRMGALLRKYSLDELPQLWNVLLGDMSLVGPRPIVNEEAARYAESFQFYKKVKPGITGLWQVSGRNNTTYKERVRLDEYYVRNWSIWLDIYILLRTFRVVCQGEGAY
jgi:Undecaprenyl-phosphate galactose phosphotransferase WbaP